MKIEEQVLTIEQMKYLQDLGVDTSDASMCWLKYTRSDGAVRYLIKVNDISCHVMPTMDAFPTYTIGDLIEKLSNVIISDYEFKVTIKNHITESVFIENNVMEDYVKSHNPKNALYKTLCLVARYYPELLKAETSKTVCCEETDDDLQLTT